MKINETGRSMIEMLGVLAIVGVLSVGGVAGYSKAMVKAKVNKTIDLLVETTANVHHAFLKKTTNYSSLTTTYAIAHNLVPDNFITGGGDVTEEEYSKVKEKMAEALGSSAYMVDQADDITVSCYRGTICGAATGENWSKYWSYENGQQVATGGSQEFKDCMTASPSEFHNMMAQKYATDSDYGKTVTNPFGGDTEIYGTGNYFAIALDGIPKGACVELVDQNWESVDAFSGMAINEEVVTATGTSSATVTTSSSSTSSSNSALYCEDSNEVVFYFK